MIFRRGKYYTLQPRTFIGKSGCGTFGAGSFKAYLKEEDSLDLWYGKAVEEGFYINDQDWLKKHFDTIGARVKELEAWGVVFEKTKTAPTTVLRGRAPRTSAPSRRSCSTDRSSWKSCAGFVKKRAYASWTASW